MKEIQVELFAENNVSDLQESINGFLDERLFENVIDIKYTVDLDVYCTAMVIYTKMVKAVTP